MVKDVLIIGGGIVGLCSAYFLQKKGHRVTVVDRSDITSGASFVNAGYITPSHIVPLASPGMISKGIKWMFNSSSPFYMQPRWDTDFFKWSWYFHKSSTKEKVALAIPLIKEINLLSRELFTSIRNSGDLGGFQLERKGLLMLYKTEKEGEHEIQVAEKASSLGLEVNLLNKKELDNLQPNVTMDVKGAVHYECDGHTTPTEFMKKMLEYLKKNGAIIKTNEEVVDLATRDGRITKVTTNKEDYFPEEVVMAAGSWSNDLSKKMNIKLSLQAGKGYRINVPRPTGITIPAILLEAKVAVTPMLEYTRFAGTMEFSGINDVIRKQRVEAIANAATQFYPEIKINGEEKADAKSGLRPVSPDGLPYIGKHSSLNNLTLATGHAMMGWSLGPVTGKLVSEIISDQKTAMDISGFSPNRRF
ncbi:MULTISPECIES: FAD-binding oxidoreductase [unclassified Arenibacter]|uniref:NAD(P)/FAD-dependent oxidoreductase n=1 Tax=unclassified Arenibacter TaxID=2615047 RepID=UPI000E341B71|nr:MULTISPECIES: FAD-dependent oxidoreductase [unclassified Arenibacter]MCM4163055.1 amino acid dehydrogenase [Arenibacter sp. A80]RFT57091.1 FAD-dependent oxidoreductase [Arenibacter sp. P308M17]